MSSILPPLKYIPADVVALADYEGLARERMTANAWGYVAGGAADEITLRRNREAFDTIELRGRVLADLSQGHTEVTLLGKKLAYPMLLAPVAYQKLVHAQGELATVDAASAMSAGMVLSTQASVTLEDVAQRATAPLWFQLYIQHDREFTCHLIQRAEAAGYDALVVTVDAPVNGIRNREQRIGFTLPTGVDAVNLLGMKLPEHTSRDLTEAPFFGTPLVAAVPTWRDFEWLLSVTRLPVIVKGVTHEDDAERFVDLGAAGIIVSNHGGRTLDTLAPTIHLLPRIAQRVNKRIPLLLDGGIRRGTDVLKAIALGAQAVLIGRPYIYALAAAGSLGVAHTIAILRAELETAMALTGCAHIDDVPSSIVLQTQ